MKPCKVCGETKPLSDFYRAAGMRDGYRSDCKACNLAAKAARTAKNPQANRDRVRKWQLENADRYRARQRAYKQRPDRKRIERDRYLQRTYGITLEDYDKLLEAQAGLCTICGGAAAGRAHATRRPRS